MDRLYRVSNYLLRGGIVLMAALLAAGKAGADVSASFTGRIQSPACRATTASQDVPLGTHMVADFSAVGKRVGMRPFVVSLSCERDPGTIGIFLETSQPDPLIAGALALSLDSVARGMVIQVMDDAGAPITWGRPLYGRSTGGPGSVDISLRAAYYQKLGPRGIVAGTANGLATFTIVYQ